MLENLTAERYYGDAVGGATEPSKMGCSRPDGTTIDIFVKCSSQNCPPGGLAREVIGALLAEAIGIPVGQPALVTVEPELLRMVSRVAPDASARMRNSVIPMYGSIALGAGYSLCHRDMSVESSVYQTAIEIWAFDQLILNSDRNERKPNCMLNGEELVMIDHEKALLVETVGSFLQPAPWQANWLPYSGHLFNSAVLKKAPNLDRLHNAWRCLNKVRIQEIFTCIPESWSERNILSGISKYLVDLHENLDSAFENLKRVEP